MQWIKIDVNNFPDELGEVLAANFTEGTFGYKEKILGYISKDEETGEIIGSNEYEELENVTHYIDIHSFDLVDEDL